MYISDLVDGINLETKDVEFKGVIDEANSVKWLKTLVAFANTDGGTMYIGVDNKTHKILALDHDTTDKILLMVNRLVKQRIDPKISMVIDSIPVPGTDPIRYIITISIEKSKNLPVALHIEGMLGIYIREYGETVIASSEQIRELVLMSENIPFDISFTDIPYNSLKYTKLVSVCKERGTVFTEKQLILDKIISEKKYISTGLQLFQDDYDGLKTKVVAMVWPSFNKGSSVVIASEEYTGNLLEVLEKSIQFIQNHSANGFKKENDRTTPYFSYPARSVLEGLANAMAHRNYYIDGSQIEINIYRDRLEIVSPGSLLGIKNLVKETDIASIIPRRRNEIICKLLSMCKYMENKGSGFDHIEEDYSYYPAQYKPSVSSDSSSFTLCLPDLTYNGNVFNSDGIRNINILKVCSVKNADAILSFCYDNAKTAKEIAEHLGVTPSTYFRSNIIKKLVQANLLIEVTNGKTSTYESNKEFVTVY